MYVTLRLIIGRCQMPRLDENNDRTCNRRYFWRIWIPQNTEQILESQEVLTMHLTRFCRKRHEFTDRLMQRMRKKRSNFAEVAPVEGINFASRFCEKTGDLTKLSNVDHVHFHGFYIGNFPSLEPQMVRELCNILKLGGVMSQLWKIRSSRHCWSDPLV